MKAVRDSGGDYHVYLNSGELEKAVIPNGTFSPLRYPVFSSEVISDDGTKTKEWLALTCTNYCTAAFAPGGIDFKRTEDDPNGINVFVFTPRMMKPKELSHRFGVDQNFVNIYTHGFLMTRLDGHSDKIWIRPEEPV